MEAEQSEAGTSTLSSVPEHQPRSKRKGGPLAEAGGSGSDNDIQPAKKTKKQQRYVNNSCTTCFFERPTSLCT